MRLRRNDGFTLVELMVTILISTMVTAVAATTILYGLHINNQSAYVQSQQNATRMLITILEDMASDGSVGEVVTDFGAWELRETPTTDDNNKKVLGKLLCYYKDGAICAADGTVIMDGILMSNAILNTNRTLLTVDVETKEGIFTSSIHCRMPPEQSGEAAPELDQEAALKQEAIKELGSDATMENRMDFLNVLVKERDSKGWITLSNPLTYYSQWYITTAEGEDGLEKWKKGDWNPGTAWCACSISWALNQQKNTLYVPRLEVLNEQTGKPLVDRIKDGEPYWFADVDQFMAYFQLLNKEKTDQQYWVDMKTNPSADRPNPGDIIFFDTDQRDTDETTDHVGVVFHVEEGTDTIYTIEGNSLGKVAIRQYSATNKTILGYGVLPWIPNLSELIVGTWQNKEGKTITFSDDKSGICFTENMNIPDCDWVFNTDTNSYAVTARNIASTATIQIINHNDNLYLIMDGNYEKPFALVP